MIARHFANLNILFILTFPVPVSFLFLKLSCHYFCKLVGKMRNTELFIGDLPIRGVVDVKFKCRWVNVHPVCTLFIRVKWQAKKMFFQTCLSRSILTDEHDSTTIHLYLSIFQSIFISTFCPWSSSYDFTWYYRKQNRIKTGVLKISSFSVMTGIMPNVPNWYEKKQRKEGRNRGREREKKEITGTCNCDRSIFQKRKRNNTKQKVPRKPRENPEGQYTVEPPCATTSCKRPPPISDRQPKTPTFS